MLARMERDHAKPPATVLAYEGDKFVPNPRGALAEFRPLDPNETYYIGADVAMGVSRGDWSVAQVLDSDKRQVAKFRARVHPDAYADILNALGRRYNNARLAVESNNHGILTNSRLAKELHYENLYIRETVDKLTDVPRDEPGFDTNSKTKPLILDQLRAAFRDGEITLYDRNTFQELRTFIVTEEGRTQAEAGTDVQGEKIRDDEVMSLAICNHIHEGKFTPVETPDDYYIEAL
jgi:hypothetical protein